MFYQLKNGQSVFAEITNPIHGGLGWEFGTCMWSPVKNHAGVNSWALMREVKPGDLIIHLLKLEHEYKFVGVSIAESACQIINVEPTIPDKWKAMAPYYRIDLANYYSFQKPVSVNEFFNQNGSSIGQFGGSFFVEYGTSGLFRMAQRYIARIPADLYIILNEFFSLKEEKYSEHMQLESITQNEPSQIDRSYPNSVLSTIYRRIRDTKMIRAIKTEHDYTCQICGRRIPLPNGAYYAEGHHLQPLGGVHNGPDNKDNIIILCPYHHAEFDYGSIAINPRTWLIEHIDKANPFYGAPLAYTRNDLNIEFIKYHYNNIFDI